PMFVDERILNHYGIPTLFRALDACDFVLPLPPLAVERVGIADAIALIFIGAKFDAAAEAIPHPVYAVLLDHARPHVCFARELIFDASIAPATPLKAVVRLGVLDLINRISFFLLHNKFRRRPIPKFPLPFIDYDKGRHTKVWIYVIPVEYRT